MKRIVGQVGSDLIFRSKMAICEIHVPSEPHFDNDLAAIFPRILARSRSYLEYGSGGSTLLADRLKIRTFAVESDHAFASAVRSRLSEGSQVRVEHVNIGMVGEWGIPTIKRASKTRLEAWLRYVRAPFQGDGGGDFDTVLIDGRFRKACALEVARQAAWRGGNVTIILDDYVDRPHYADIERFLGMPRIVGRAAIFEIVGGGVSCDLTPDIVRVAALDWR